MLAGPAWQWAMALAVGLMAAIVVLPIPFGNVLPAAALMFIGVGLVFRDGMAIGLRLLMSVLATGVTFGLLLMAGVLGGDWIAAWL